MGEIASSKMPGPKKKARKDNTDFTEYAKGGKVGKTGGGGKASAMARKLLDKPGSLKASDMYAGGGLYANIAAKKKRIASGSGEKMKSAGDKGAPKKSDFANAAKTVRYAEGGKTKSKVNEAGNYTKPELRKRIFNSVKAAAVQGTGAGQWSARKAQLMAKKYKAAGGSYK
jgi:hypothetical protein